MSSSSLPTVPPVPPAAVGWFVGKRSDGAACFCLLFSLSDLTDFEAAVDAIKRASCGRQLPDGARMKKNNNDHNNIDECYSAVGAVNGLSSQQEVGEQVKQDHVTFTGSCAVVVVSVELAQTLH